MASATRVWSSALSRPIFTICSLCISFLLAIAYIPEARAAQTRMETQRLNITFEMGNDATMTCTVRDIGKKRVIWRRLADPFPISVGTTRFAPGNKYRVKRQGDNWRLKIRNVKVSDAGEYECRVSGSDDIADVLSLIIPGRDQTYIMPTDAIVKASPGQTVVLPCHVQRLHKHVVLWQGQDRQVISLRRKVYNGNKRMRVQHALRDEWSLRISRLTEKDFGVYTCVVNTDPPLTRSVTLQRVETGADKVPETGGKVPETGGSTGGNPVLVKENFNEQVTVLQGQTATLTCQFTGEPTPRIRWSRRFVKNGQKVTESLNSEGETYSVKNAQPVDAGLYVCTATNGSPPPATGKITVNVIEPTTTTTPTTTTEFDPTSDAKPRAYALDEVVYQRRGRDVELTCKGVGIPRPLVSWMFREGPVHVDWKHKLNTTHPRHHTTRSVLSIRSMSRSDVGVYVCQAYNRYGHTSVQIELKESQ